jgi:hypothetical protein
MGRGTRFVVRLSLHGTVHFREIVSAWALLSHWPGSPGKPLEAPFFQEHASDPWVPIPGQGPDSRLGDIGRGAAMLRCNSHPVLQDANRYCVDVNRFCTCSNAIDWYISSDSQMIQDPIPTPPAPNANPNTKTELGTKYLKKHAANPPRPSRIPALGLHRNPPIRVVRHPKPCNITPASHDGAVHLRLRRRPVARQAPTSAQPASRRNATPAPPNSPPTCSPN